jgi:hypothetical protein
MQGFLTRSKILRYGTDGFTSRLKEGVLLIFFRLLQSIVFSRV